MPKSVVVRKSLFGGRFAIKMEDTALASSIMIRITSDNISPLREKHGSNVHYRVTTKSLDRITTQERRRLNYLTLRSDEVNISAMREDILWRQRQLCRIQLFLVKDSSGIIVAWCSVMPSRKHTAYIYTYVMRAHRRCGLGTRLINRAILWCKLLGRHPKVISWDTRSVRFFSRSAKKVKMEVANGFFG